eukprot:g2742.t1
MGAAVASTTVAPIAESSSPVPDIGCAVVSTSDADETATTGPPSEHASGCLGGSAPEPAEAAGGAAVAAGRGGGSAARAARCSTEDLVAALAVTNSATAISTTRRASIPCRRSEKHPAAIRRRPFSVGSSSIALLDGCLETGNVLPLASASSEKRGAVDDIGSCAAVGCSGDHPLPAPEEPPTPPCSTRDTKTPVSIERSFECGILLQQQQQQQQQREEEQREPSTVSVIESTNICLSTVPPDSCPLPPEEGPSTPHTASCVLVDYATSPSASGSPTRPEKRKKRKKRKKKNKLETSSLTPGESSTPSSTFCALAALADYGRTVSKPRRSQQPLEEGEGYSKLWWDQKAGSSPDETTGEGAPVGEREVVDEAPATTDREVPSDEPVAFHDLEKEEEEEGNVLPGSDSSLEEAVGECGDKQSEAEEAQVVELEPIMVAGVPVQEGGDVEVRKEESVILASAELYETSAIAYLEDVSDAVEVAAPSPASSAAAATAQGTSEHDELERAVLIAEVDGVAQSEEPFEVANPDEIGMVLDETELVLGVPSPAPAPGAVNGEAVEPAVLLEEAATEASRAPPERPAAAPAAEVVSRSDGPSEPDQERPVRRSGRRRSIAVLTAPAPVATAERVEVSTSGGTAELCDGQGAFSAETALPAPRRSRRRRSIAPRMPLLAAPAPSPTPAPADTAAAMETTSGSFSSAPAEGTNDQERFMSKDDQGGTESLTAAPSPVTESDAVASESSVGVELGGGEATLAPGPARPPRRSGRRRSITPSMQALAATPSPAPIPATSTATATAETPVVVRTPEPLPPAAAESSGRGSLLLPEDQQRDHQVPLVAAPPTPVAAVPSPVAVAATSESSPSFPGAGLSAGEDILPLETARPPRRSGRRRSIAPRMPALTAAPSPSPGPAAADPRPPTAATPPAPLLSGGVEGPSDQDNVLPQEQREALPPARSGRRRSVAVPRRRGTDDGAAEVEYGAPPPSAAAAAAAVGAPSVSGLGGDAASSEEKTDKRGPAIAAEAGATTPVQQGELAMQQRQQQEESTSTSTSTRRRSRRRKSMRGLPAGGSLLEDDDASQKAEEPLAQAVGSEKGGGGGGAPWGMGQTDVATEGMCEAEMVQTTEGGIVGGEQGQTAVMADLLLKCMEAVRAEVPSGDTLLPHLESVSAALADAEACVLKHDEMRAAVAGHQGRSAHAGGRKMVRLCAFDFSTVGLPLDTTVGSGRQAEEVVRSLERVIGAQHDLHEALRVCSGAGDGSEGGGGDGGGGNGLATWRVLLRQLHAAAASASCGAGIVKGASSLAPRGEEGGGGGGGGGGVEIFGVRARETETSNAARVLVGELEPLERLEGPIHSPLRNRLASMLSSLIRFTLRIRLDAPPERLTRAPEVLPPDGDPSAQEERRRAGMPPPTHFSKVHKLVDIPDTDATLGAAFSKALLRLEGFSGEVAAHIFAAAEAFESSDHTASTSTGSRLCEKDGCRERVESARQLVLAAADVVDAVRARKFVLSLLEFEGVQEAIVEAGGWGSVESWASTLRKLECSADIDTPLTLLSDVEALIGWLRCETSWGHAAEKAEGVLRRLLDTRPLKEVEERARQRWMCPEAYQLLRQDVLEAQERFKFPEVKRAAAAPVTPVEAEPEARAEAEAEPTVEKTRSKSGGKGKEGRKKSSASASAAPPNKSRNKKSNGKSSGSGSGSKAGAGKGRRAIVDGGKQGSLSSSSSPTSSAVVSREDGAPGSGTGEKDNVADYGKDTSKLCPLACRL